MLYILMLGNIVDSIEEKIKGWWASFIEYTVWRVFYWLETAVCKFLALVEEVMMVFTGEKPVLYNDKSMPLIDVFFNHDSVRGIYAAVGLIGIVFAFGFAIVSVIRKTFDLRGKQQNVTLGSILTNLLKSILLIFGMNAVMLASLAIVSTLTDQLSYSVQNGPAFSLPKKHIEFDDEDYAAMGRIINTLGNYSLNPSYKSRYSLNACYNDIRKDLILLDEKGVLDYHYVTKIEDKEVLTWQAVIESIATVRDFYEEVPLDYYDEALVTAMLNAMDVLEANPKMMVLTEYDRPETVISKSSVPMDRIMFLIGTMGNIDSRIEEKDVVVNGVKKKHKVVYGGAARNDVYNIEPSFTDNLRLPYYLGEKEKDIYDYDTIRADFNPSPMKTNYILVYCAGVAILSEMIIIIVTCSVRIFNLLVLYIISPLVIAAFPLDDGAKFKQWTTAFLVQLLGVVGMVLSMRLFLMFLPIIWSPTLKTFDNPLLNVVVKTVITYGAITAVNKVNGILTGILADNAGWQAISAGDMRGEMANSTVGQMLGAVSGSNIGKKIASSVGSKAGSVVGGMAKGAATKMGLMKEDPEKMTPEAKQRYERKRNRQMDDMRANLDHASKHGGKDLNGKDLTGDKRAMMESTLKHMEDGKSLSEAKSLAAIDVEENKNDEKQRIANETKALKAAPPARELPANQNNQV